MDPVALLLLGVLVVTFIAVLSSAELEVRVIHHIPPRRRSPLTRVCRRLRSAVLGFLGRCEFCSGRQEQRHQGCLYCNDVRYCHGCAKTFYFASLYGYRY